MSSLQLFLVHCGYYDKAVAAGASECHANFFVAAVGFAAARTRAKSIPEFKAKRMHIDSLTRIDAVDGMRVELVLDQALDGTTLMTTANGWAKKDPDQPSQQAPSGGGLF